MRAATQRVLRILCALYVLLIVYGSLFPFGPLHLPEGGMLAFLHRPLLLEYTRKRLAENLFIYMPFGFLLVAPEGRLRGARALLLAGVAGAALSLAMEILQQLTPARHASLIDAISNTTGTLLGAAVALAAVRPTALRMWLQAQRARFRPGHVVDAALGSAALWVLSEWSPFVPVTTRAALIKNLHPALAVLSHHSFRVQPCIEYACYMAGLLVLLASVRRTNAGGAARFGLLAAAVLLLKPLFRHQPVSLEAVAGLASALLLAALLRPLGGRMRWAMLLLVIGFTLHLLQPRVSPLSDFNLLPFRYQTNLPIDSVPYVLSRLWPFLALGCLGALSAPSSSARREAVAGGLAVLVFTFGLEWWQHSLHVWFGDITTVLLAAAGWTVPWLLWAHDHAADEAATST